jgi:osmotically-inducible protein OsmY
MPGRTVGTALATLTFALLAITAPAGRAAAAEREDLSTKVRAAKTAADHEALAAQYDRQAADAKAMAAEHRRMGEVYKGRPAVSGGKGAGVSSMPEHCEAIAKSYDAQAKTYAELAAAERALATAAK